MNDALQLHDGDGDTCDTISSVRVPVIVVPGVMGSRLDLSGSSLSWDPDSGGLAKWISATKTGRREVRRALRPASTSASTKTEFPSTPLSWGMGKAKASLTGKTAVLASDRCRAIGTLNGGSDDDAIVSYYATFRNWASVVWLFYGKVLISLEQSLNPTKDDPDFPVYAFGYDWRQSNTDSGSHFRDFVAKIIDRHGAQDAIVITHSMGGLVVRGGIAGDSSINQKIRGVVHTAQPSNGAVACYRRFLTGVSEPVDSRSIGADWLLSNIMGPTATEFAYTLSGLPGPLQLLPNKLFVTHVSDWLGGLDSSCDLTDVYNVYRMPSAPGLAGIVAGAEEEIGSLDERQGGAVRSDFAASITEAESFHDTVNGVAHPRTYAIYSTGMATDTSIVFQNLSGSISAPDSKPAHRWARNSDGDWVDQWNEVVFQQPPSGDKTVPETSAMCPDLTLVEPAQTVQGVEHSQVLADGDCIAWVTTKVNFLKTPTSP